MKKILRTPVLLIVIVFLAFSVWFLINRTSFGKEKIDSSISISEYYYKGFSSIYYHSNEDYLIGGGCRSLLCFEFIPLVKKIDVDPIHFEIISGSPYSKDEKTVFYFGKKLNGIDATSFKIIENMGVNDINPWLYSKDNKNVYMAGVDNLGEGALNIIDGADPKTFLFIGEHYAKDNHNVYYFGGELVRNIKGTIPQSAVVLKGADSATFISLECDFYKDKSGVYYRGKKIEVADVQTFTKLPECYFKDKNHVYNNAFEIREQSGIITDADPSTFYLISKYISADKNHTYEYGKKIK
ncbi:MAG: DKNYY domain-containing protein [Candidatus Pacebacteria bacterium]|nr:DKNYY domain-containing protein [Candidatus Paceibacterota bacterium]